MARIRHVMMAGKIAAIGYVMITGTMAVIGYVMMTGIMPGFLSELPSYSNGPKRGEINSGNKKTPSSKNAAVNMPLFDDIFWEPSRKASFITKFDFKAYAHCDINQRSEVEVTNGYASLFSFVSVMYTVLPQDYIQKVINIIIVICLIRIIISVVKVTTVLQQIAQVCDCHFMTKTLATKQIEQKQKMQCLEENNDDPDEECFDFDDEDDLFSGGESEESEEMYNSNEEDSDDENMDSYSVSQLHKKVAKSILQNCEWAYSVAFHFKTFEVTVKKSKNISEAEEEITNILNSYNLGNWEEKLVVEPVLGVEFSYTDPPVSVGDSFKSERQPHEARVGAYVYISRKGIHFLSTGHGKIIVGEKILTNTDDSPQPFAVCKAMKFTMEPSACDVILARPEQQRNIEQPRYLNKVVGADNSEVFMDDFVPLSSKDRRSLEGKACFKFDKEFAQGTRGVISCTDFYYRSRSKNIHYCISIERSEGNDTQFSVKGESGKMVVLAPGENRSAKAVGLIFGVEKVQLSDKKHKYCTLLTPSWRAFREIASTDYCGGVRPKLLKPKLPVNASAPGVGQQMRQPSEHSLG